MSRLADYGVVLMAHIAGRPVHLHTTAAVAAATHVPEPTAGKILKALSRHRLLASQRGMNGGYTLARAAADITITDVITAVDGPIALTECLEADGGACNLEFCCPTRGNWRKINVAIQRALDGITLADMLEPTPLFTIPTTPDDGIGRKTAHAERALPNSDGH